MKKILISIFVTIFSLSFVNAADNNRPQWTEFYSEHYLNMALYPTDKEALNSSKIVPRYCSSEKKWVKGLVYGTIIPAVGCAESRLLSKAAYNNYNKTAAFWNETQEAFETSLAGCDSLLKGQKENCYAKLRASETLKTQDKITRKYSIYNTLTPP